tara:strand:- start:16365 stop:17009 length:645 start_codon:yes stop_codon:yes gene_type:complete
MAEGRPADYTPDKFRLNEDQLNLASELTVLQRKFVIELIKPNTTQRQAYLAAGGQGKTENAQDSSANTMFSNVKVRAFYDSLMEEITANAVYTKEKAIERLSNTARVTIKDVCDFKNSQVGEDEEGKPVYQTTWVIKNSEDIPDHIAAAIKSVSITKDGPKLELHDSHGSIKQLADMLAWNAPKKTEVTGADGGALQHAITVEFVDANESTDSE